MAVKRKTTDGAGVSSPKKPRTAKAQEPQLGWDSDDESDEYTPQYTEDGTLRAHSEARRHWDYVCPIETCKQRFNRPCRLEAHMRTHTKERPFACPENDCDKTFPRKDHLSRHIKIAHNGQVEDRKFVCEWSGCGKSFSTNARLQRHKEAHESKFYCTDYPPCNEVFRKASTLEAHIRSEHLEERPYPCTFVHPDTGEECTAGYLTAASLQRHVDKAHLAVGQEEHFCMLCTSPDAELEAMDIDSGDNIMFPTQPLSFATKAELQTHTEECHPPTCTECGQKFKSAQNLKSHFDVVHGDPTKQPQFLCPNPGCDSIFNRKHNLAVHVQSVHEKQMKFFCTKYVVATSKHDDLNSWNGENACGDGFKAKNSLEQHIRTQHLGLGNRKQRRKAAKSKKKPDPSMLTLLTGIGYEKGRDVPCLAKSCEFRFYMDRDLRRHLRATHKLPEDQIEEMIFDRDAMAGGQFWIGGLDDQMNVPESTEPSMPQTPMPYFTSGSGGDATLVPQKGGEHAANATDPPAGFFGPQFDDLSWLDEEAEMDVAMGLDGLSAATDVHEGLGWSGVAQFDADHAMEGGNTSQVLESLENWPRD